MIFGYARVSTKTQARDGNSIEAQILALKEAGVEKVYIDSFTGTKMERPGFDKLRNCLRKGDILIVTKLDRLGRSVSQASALITELINEGVTINVLNLGILSNDSMNTLMRNVLLAFAQNEREIIRKRQEQGIAAAKAKGAKFGRPELPLPEDFESIIKLWDKGKISTPRAANLCHMSETTFYRRVREYKISNGK